MLPLLVQQFRDPTVSDCHGITQRSTVGQMHSQVHIKRPSDFRRISLNVAKNSSSKILHQGPKKGEKHNPTRFIIMEDVQKLIDMVDW